MRAPAGRRLRLVAGLRNVLGSRLKSPIATQLSPDPRPVTNVLMVWSRTGASAPPPDRACTSKYQVLPKSKPNVARAVLVPLYSGLGNAATASAERCATMARLTRPPWNVATPFER